jgi:hypothetical protein
MEVLDEKANGALMQEIEEIIPVTNRTSFRFPACGSLNIISLDEAFVLKHMPDLGHDVKDFKVFTWHLTSWKKLDKKLTGPEFDCGGHKWWVVLHLNIAVTFDCFSYCLVAGASSFSPSEIPMLLLMIPSPYILTTPSPKNHQRGGMLVPSLPLSFQTPMIPPSIPLAVSTCIIIDTHLSHLVM